MTISIVETGVTYSSIQEAVNAAANGNTIEIAAGTYTEDVTITDKFISIDGVETGGVNNVTLNGKITVAGTLNGAFSITDLNINAAGKAYGVLVSAASTGFAGSVTLDDVAISNAQRNGFAYIHAGNESAPTLGDTIGAVSILNSEFSNNATANGSNGRGDILLFGYNQDLTITNVAISSPGAFAQKAIQMRGIQDVVDVVNAGPYDPAAGDVAINNLTVTGTYAQDLIAFYRIASFSSFAMSGVDLQASAPWGLFNFDEVGGAIDLSSGLSLTTANLFPGGPIAAEQGLATGDTFIGTSGTDVLAGRDGADILSGGGGNDTIIGGAGADTATGYNASYHLAIQGGHWVVTNGSETDQLTGVEKVVINGTTYLLVDQFGANGGYQHVQDAINAASGAATILIAPGTYTESGSDGFGRTVGLYINKPNLTLQGVDANGAFITTSSGASTSGAIIIPGHQAGFGANHWVDFGGDGTTVQGLHLQAGVETNNKLLEIWGDNVTVKNDFIDIHRGGTVDTQASAVYINDNGTTTSEISSYAITGNVLNGAIVVANGVGDPSTHQFGATQLITNNRFEGTFDYNTGLGRYTDIVLNGQSAGTPWLLAPTQIPTITGNAFSDNSTPIILRGLDDDRANFPTVSQVDQILAANGDNNTTYAYVIDPSSGLLRTDDPIIGGGTSSNPTSIATHRFIVANSVDTLNLALDTTADTVFSGPRGYIHDGDTVVVQSGATGTVNSAIMVDNLTVKATAHSTDLNLTLATHKVDGTAIAGGGVHNVTLADYAPGHGSNVDVTGNGVDNVITGNSGDNVITGGLGVDTLNGDAGNDTFRYVLGDGADVIDGGDGSDTLDYTGTASAVSVDLGMHTAAGIASFTSIENVTGGSGDDTLTGDSGANVLTGGGGNDTLDGKEGTDGTDTAAYGTMLATADVVENGAGGWTVNVGVNDTDTLSNIEFVQHSGGRYVLVGNGGFATIQEAVAAADQPGDTIKFAAAPTGPINIDVGDTDIDVTIPYDVDVDIQTGGGDNHIATGGGDNHIVTGGGDNEIVTGDGNNEIVTGDGNNEIVTGDGDNEIVTGNGDNDIVTGNGENHVVTGAGEDHVITGGGEDTVKTGGGNDVVDAGGGDDTIIGGSGNGDDVYNAGIGSDTVVYSSATNGITVNLTQTDRSAQSASGGGTIGDLLTAALLDPHTPVGKAQGVDIGTDALIGVENVVGGAGNDDITGNIDANILTGARGNDILNGGAGDDTLNGGFGIDTAVFSGLRSAYTITRSDIMPFTLFVSGPDGSDTLTRIEKLRFDDGTVPSGLGSVHSDFSGDSTSDLLWRHDSGQVYFWNMNGLQTNAEGSVTHAPVPNDWHIQGAGDFNGDGSSDVLWRHDSGQIYVWEMDGLQITGEGGVMHAPVTNDWQMQGTGDFNGDGNSDVLWRQDGSGQIYTWEMDGLGIKAEGAVAHAAVTNDWQVQGIGDFNGDGNSDVLWRQDDSGQVYVWEMEGSQVKAEGAVAHAPVTNDWHVQGIGDFNGDGNSDVLWRQNDSGQVYIWEMDGQQVKAEGAVAHAPVTNDWHVQSVGDFNGDGNSDVLWRHDSGQVYVWEMEGLQVKAEGAVAHAGVPNDWHILA